MSEPRESVGQDEGAGVPSEVQRSQVQDRPWEKQAAWRKPGQATATAPWVARGKEQHWGRTWSPVALPSWPEVPVIVVLQDLEIASMPQFCN